MRGITFPMRLLTVAKTINQTHCRVNMEACCHHDWVFAEHAQELITLTQSVVSVSESI